MGRKSQPHDGAYRDCLDFRERFEDDPHLAVSHLDGIGTVLIFDPHSQLPRSEWNQGRRPPGLAARNKRKYMRSNLIDWMIRCEANHLVIVHGGRNGCFWKTWALETFDDCEPMFLDRNEAISLMSPPSLNE
jgi:hypothetical protein